MMRKYLDWKNMDGHSKSRENVLVGQRETLLKQDEGGECEEVKHQRS